MSQTIDQFPELDLSDLPVDSVDVLSVDAIAAEGHGELETGSSSYTSYCSSYFTATSCWAPEQPTEQVDE